MKKNVNNAKNFKFKTWDELVEENSYEPLEFEVNGHAMTVSTPTGSQIKKLTEAGEDLEAVILALFGDEDGQVILEAWDSAPASVLSEFVQQILEYFGLADSEGNPRVNSRS